MREVFDASTFQELIETTASTLTKDQLTWMEYIRRRRRVILELGQYFREEGLASSRRLSLAMALGTVDATEEVLFRRSLEVDTSERLEPPPGEGTWMLN